MNQLFKHLRGVPFIFPSDTVPTLISGGFVSGVYLAAQYAQNPDSMLVDALRFVTQIYIFQF